MPSCLKNAFLRHRLVLAWAVWFCYSSPLVTGEDICPNHTSPRNPIMHAFWRCGFWVLTVCFVASGCHDPLLYVSPAYWAPDDDSDEIAQYGATPSQRTDAVRELAKQAKSGDERAVSELVQRIGREADPLVRVEIVMALGEAPSPATRQVLRAAADDPDPEVRIACCSAWAKIGQRQSHRSGRIASGASEVLAKMLGSDTDLDVQIAAARALGKFNDGGNLDALAVALEEGSPDIAVQYRAMESMGAVSGQDYGFDAEKWRQYAAGNRPAATETPSIASRIFPWF